MGEGTDHPAAPDTFRGRLNNLAVSNADYKSDMDVESTSERYNDATSYSDTDKENGNRRT